MTDDRMADHWWWRPGWKPGRRMYTWHFTFDGQPPVHELAASYQERLAELPGLDLIPARWLHLTTQGVGFTDEVSEDEVTAILGASTGRLEGFAPQGVTLGPARVTPEAILLDVAPAEGLAAIRRELRAAITGILGASRLGESDEWTPHVSVAYSNGTGPQGPYVAAVADGGIAETVITTVELIVLSRDKHLYEWTTRGDVRLAGDTAGVPGSALRQHCAHQRAIRPARAARSRVQMARIAKDDSIEHYTVVNEYVCSIDDETTWPVSPIATTDRQAGQGPGLRWSGGARACAAARG